MEEFDADLQALLAPVAAGSSSLLGDPVLIKSSQAVFKTPKERIEAPLFESEYSTLREHLLRDLEQDVQCLRSGKTLNERSTRRLPPLERPQVSPYTVGKDHAREEFGKLPQVEQRRLLSFVKTLGAILKHQQESLWRRAGAYRSHLSRCSILFQELTQRTQKDLASNKRDSLRRLSSDFHDKKGEVVVRVAEMLRKARESLTRWLSAFLHKIERVIDDASHPSVASLRAALEWITAQPDPLTLNELVRSSLVLNQTLALCRSYSQEREETLARISAHPVQTQEVAPFSDTEFQAIEAESDRYEQAVEDALDSVNRLTESGQASVAQLQQANLTLEQARKNFSVAQQRLDQAIERKKSFMAAQERRDMGIKAEIASKIGTLEGIETVEEAVAQPQELIDDLSSEFSSLTTGYLRMQEAFAERSVEALLKALTQIAKPVVFPPDTVLDNLSRVSQTVYDMLEPPSKQVADFFKTQAETELAEFADALCKGFVWTLDQEEKQ